MFKDFYVIAVISNPIRSSKRLELFKRFERYMSRCEAKLITVELRYGERPWEITFPDFRNHVRLETMDELWHKENLMNIGVQNLPDTWKYVAFIDADIEFMRPDWIEETVHQLQHHKVVQMFSHAIDLGPQHEHLMTHSGFVYQYIRNSVPPKKYGEWHPGFAWAWRRDAFNDVGGLIEFAILGAADNHMAKGLVAKIKDSIHKDMNHEYSDRLKTWEDKALRHIKKNIGYVPGTIFHLWHGRKANRFYWDRWQILTKNKYNPETDIKYDWQKVIQLETHTDRQIKLRDDLKRYFLSRKEDANYTED